MKIAGIIFLLSLPSFIGWCDEESRIPSFTHFVSGATSIDIISTRQRSVTFVYGSVLRPADGQDSEVKRVYTVFFQATEKFVRLTPQETLALKELSINSYDATAEPKIGWSGAVVIRQNSENGEPRYWMCLLMNAGYLSFFPAEELYEAQSDGRSFLFQGMRSDAARAASFAVESPEWTERLKLLLVKDEKRRKTEQNAAEQPASRSAVENK